MTRNDLMSGLLGSPCRGVPANTDSDGSPGRAGEVVSHLAPGPFPVAKVLQFPTLMEGLTNTGDPFLLARAHPGRKCPHVYGGNFGVSSCPLGHS